MPTIASANIPPPKSWDEFESIALSACKIRWDNSDFYRNGRLGQKQNGVDIWGHNDEGCHIGVQCKNTIDGISLAVVKAEIVEAETFQPKLDRLYIATTAKRDAELQKAVRELTRARAELKRFKVNILFWDDICRDLAENEGVFFSHFPQFRNSVNPTVAYDKKLFDELLTLLASDGVIDFLDTHNMAGSFRLGILDPLYEFSYKWKKAEREFISERLDYLRKTLLEKVDSYLHVIAYQTFPGRRSDNLQSVPAEWEDEQPDRYSQVINELHSSAAEIVRLQRDLVREGRQYFIVSSS